MPEPLSLLATASTLTLTAARVVKLLYELHGTLQDAPLILSSVIAECTGMRASLAVLQSTRSTLVEDEGQNVQVAETIDDMLLSCALTLSVLEREVQTYLVVGKGPNDENAVKRCKMIISEDYLSKLLDQLRGQRSGLTMLMTALNSKSLQKLKEYAANNQVALKAIARRASLIWRESDSWSKRLSASLAASKIDSLECYSVATSTQFEFDRDIIASIPYQRQIKYAHMLEQRQGTKDEDMSEWPNFAAWKSPVLSEIQEANIDHAPAALDHGGKHDVNPPETSFASIHSPKPRSECNSWQYLDDILPALQMGLDSDSDPSLAIEEDTSSKIQSSPAHTAEYEHALVTAPRETDTLKEKAESLAPTKRRPTPETFSASTKSLRSNLQPSALEPLYDTIDGAPPPRAKIKVSIRQSADRQRFLSSLKCDPCTLGYIEKAFANIWARVSSRYTSSLATRKIVLIGGCVGKTTLVHKLFRCREEHLDDIGTEYHARIALDSAQFKLIMCKDISLGGYSSTRSSLWRDCHVAVICYSIGQRNSLLEVDEWVSQVRNAEQNCSIILLGCQSDLRYDENILQHTVGYEEGLEAARKMSAMIYLECSAKTSAGVSDLFETLIKCSVLCDTHDTWTSRYLQQKQYNRKQFSTTDLSRVPTGTAKFNRPRTGFLTVSWLTDRLSAQ